MYWFLWLSAGSSLEVTQGWQNLVLKLRFPPQMLELGCPVCSLKEPSNFLFWSVRSWCIQGISLPETVFKCNAGKSLQCWSPNPRVFITHPHSAQTKFEAKDGILQVLLTWMVSPDPQLNNVMWGRGNAVWNWISSNHEKFGGAFCGFESTESWNLQNVNP